MKTVSAKLISSKPISLSKAAKILSKFTTATNGVPPAISAYLTRASDAFNELSQFHKDLNRTPKSSNHRQSKNPDNVSSIQTSHALSFDLDGESSHVKKEKKKKKNKEKKVEEEREERGSDVKKEQEEEVRENEDSGKKKKKKKKKKDKKRKGDGDGEGTLGVEIKEEEERGKKRKSEEMEERRGGGGSDETRRSKKAKKKRSLSEN